MSNYIYEDLFNKSTSHKEIIIETEDKTVKITNSELHFEEFELQETLCDEEYLKFGLCNSSQLKFKISNVFTSMIGKQINVSAVINGHTDTPFIFGKYRVISDKPTDDKRYRNVTAYDALYDVGEANVASWYNSLTFPLTLKAFRNSFFAYFGIEQVETTLVNDDMEVTETIKPSELSGQTVIEAICEINGCFGHMNHEGKFQYIFLKEIIKGLYPSKTLFPSKDLFPRKGNINEKIGGGKYKTVKYEDFECKKITKLQIRQSENDIGAVYPDTEITEQDNSYIVQDNFLVYGMSADALEIVAKNLFEVIKVVSYRPFDCEKIGNPCLELGEAVNVYTNSHAIISYVLSRVYKGIQQPMDTISAKGKSEKYAEDVNGINKSIIQLRGKTNELTRTVEETKLEIKDAERGLDTKITQNAEKIESEASRATSAEGTLDSKITQTAESITSEVKRATSKEEELSSRITQTAEQISSEVTRAQGVENTLSSRITQTAEQISLKVSKGDVSSQLSIESGQVSISGNRFVLNSTNFSISADGKVTAKSIDIQGGTINLQSASQNYSTIVLNYSNYTLGMDGAGIRASQSSNSTTLTASGVVTSGSINASQGYFDTISPKTSRGTIGFNSSVKINGDTELAAGHTHKIHGTLLVDTTAFAITSAGNVKLASSFGNVGFFGSNGATKKSVSKVTITSSVTAYSVATVLNSLLDALKAYNLIG